MKLSRRGLFKAGLGAAQIALLERAGVRILSPGVARADGNRPTKLLTIYVPGGWQPAYMLSPLKLDQIQTYVPRPRTWQVLEPMGYAREHVARNLDGTPATDDSFGERPLRMIRLWDENALLSGRPDPRGLIAGWDIHSCPNGFSWQYHRLWENCVVVHGVDQGTAEHQGGQISAMCGVAGPEYRSPAIQSWVANALYERYRDTRPLPCVSLAGGPFPNPVNLPAVAAATAIDSFNELAYILTERPDMSWAGLRNRSTRPQLNFAGQSIGAIPTNLMDERILRRARLLRGTTDSATDAFYQSLHDGYQGVSKLLARDVVTELERTRGVENTPVPYWGELGRFHWGVDLGPAAGPDSGGTWNDRFDLTLRLLKSDLCTAISLYCPGNNNFFFDTHADDAVQWPYVRSIFEVLGRFLGELKATPGRNGPSLLHDTLVVIFSEFARTWNGGSDHWPHTSVILAGAGIEQGGYLNTNRMFGGFAVDGMPPDSVGYEGLPVRILNEGGQVVMRPPRSQDIIFTALKTMGIDEFFIPGGPGEIVGVRAA